MELFDFVRSLASGDRSRIQRIVDEPWPGGGDGGSIGDPPVEIHPVPNEEGTGPDGLILGAVNTGDSYGGALLAVDYDDGVDVNRNLYIDGAGELWSKVGIFVLNSDDEYRVLIEPLGITASQVTAGGNNGDTDEVKLAVYGSEGQVAPMIQARNWEDDLVFGVDVDGGVHLLLAGIPTSDPNVAGQLWRSGTALQISLG